MAGLRQFTPPSMKGLNFNIDADLIFSGSFNKISNVNFISSTSSLTDLTLGTKTYGNSQCNIALFETGYIVFSVLDNIGNQIAVFQAMGAVALPYLDMITNRIANLGQVTTDMDAIPQTKKWVDYTPTLAWTGTGSAINVVNAGRYMQFGKTVNFIVAGNASASGGTLTSLSITMPSTCANTLINIATSNQYNSTAGVNVVGSSYISANTNLLWIYPFLTVLSGGSVYWRASGFYEVP